MNESDPVDLRGRRHLWRVLHSTLFGLVVGVLLWAALGAFLGVLIVFFAWVHGTVRLAAGYMPYTGSAASDALALAWRLGLFFAPAGSFPGAVVGGYRGARGGEPPQFAFVLKETVAASLGGLFFLIPMLLVTGLSIWTVYSEEIYWTVFEVPVTQVETGRPIQYIADVQTPNGPHQFRVQDSGSEPQVRVGDKLRIFHRGAIGEGRLLLPGQRVPTKELTGKAYFLLGLALLSFLFFGGLWLMKYRTGMR